MTVKRHPRRGANSRRQAETIIDAVIEYARRLTAWGMRRPGHEPPRG